MTYFAIMPKEIRDYCKRVGVDPDNVEEITIRCDANAPPVVDVTMHAVDLGLDDKKGAVPEPS